MCIQQICTHRPMQHNKVTWSIGLRWWWLTESQIDLRDGLKQPYTSVRTDKPWIGMRTAIDLVTHRTAFLTRHVHVRRTTSDEGVWFLQLLHKLDTAKVVSLKCLLKGTDNLFVKPTHTVGQGEMPCWVGIVWWRRVDLAVTRHCVFLCKIGLLTNRFVTAVPAEGNGDLQTLICVLVARPRQCLTLLNPVP